MYAHCQLHCHVYHLTWGKKHGKGEGGKEGRICDQNKTMHCICTYALYRMVCIYSLAGLTRKPETGNQKGGKEERKSHRRELCLGLFMSYKMGVSHRKNHEIRAKRWIGVEVTYGWVGEGIHSMTKRKVVKMLQ